MVNIEYQEAKTHGFNILHEKLMDKGPWKWKGIDGNDS